MMLEDKPFISKILHVTVEEDAVPVLFTLITLGSIINLYNFAFSPSKPGRTLVILK